MTDISLFRKINKPKDQLKVISKVAVIYTRVSTKEQAETNLSLETQRKFCLEYALEKGYEIKGEFGGTYESAKDDIKRKEFQKMLQFIKRNRDVTLVIVSTYDRFSRTGGSAIAITDQLMSCGVAVQAAKEDIDATTNSGKAMRAMKMIFSQMDNEARKEKSVDGTKTLLLKGGWAKKTPIGYSKTTMVNGIKKATINSIGKNIQKAFHMKIYERKTNTEIQEWLYSVGIKLQRQRITKLFKNPFYCGIVDDKTLDKPVKGIHEAMISEDEFLILNGITKDFLKSSHKVDDENYPLKTTLLCNKCNKPLTGYQPTGKKAKYYKCNTIGCHVNANSNHLHDKFVTLLQQYQIKAELVKPLEKQLKLTFSYLMQSQKERHSQLKILSNIREKDLSTIKRRFALGEIDRDVYTSANQEISQEINNMNIELDKTDAQLSNLDDFISFSVRIGSNTHKIWQNSDFTNRQKLQKLIFPLGITYNKELDSYRTLKVNSIFNITSSLSTQNWLKEKGQTNINDDLSLLVATRGSLSNPFLTNLRLLPAS